jgi:hypothetical protein
MTCDYFRVELHETFEQSCTILLKNRITLSYQSRFEIMLSSSKSQETNSSKRRHECAAYFRVRNLIYWNSSETDYLFISILSFDQIEMRISTEEHYEGNIASWKQIEVKNY